MIELPNGLIKANRKDPKLLVIFSLPKVGKTSALAQLPNSLLIDLEEGTDFYDAPAVKAKSITDLREIADAIAAAGRPYKYGIIDTVTVLQDIVGDLAIQMYRQTPMGKNYTGEDILTLPQGGGYYYHRMAFTKIVDVFKDLFDTLILVGHVKDKYIEKKPGEELVASELDLIGKLKSITSAQSDAIGYMFRRENKTILSFKTSDSVIVGARPDHLKNAEILLGEMTDEGLVTHWEDVFLDINK